MNKRASSDQKKQANRKKLSESIVLPSGRPIPQANPTKPFIKGGSIF